MNILLSSQDEIRFHERGGENLIVWFGGINEPHFSVKLSEESGFDLLTLTDSGNSNGLVSGHAHVEEAVKDLLSLVSSKGYQKVVFCGQSSGGYGALLYGHYCEADLCFVYSPQTRNFFDGQCKMTPHVKLYDLGDLYKNYHKTNLVFNMARSERDHETEFFWDDWRQVAKFKHHPSAVFLTFPFDNHAVSLKLRERRNLYSHVSLLIKAFL